MATPKLSTPKPNPRTSRTASPSQVLKILAPQTTQGTKPAPSSASLRRVPVKR